MKKNLLIAIWMTLATTVLLGIVYPVVVTALAQLIFPRQANGDLIRDGENIVGSKLIGQPFSSPKYFWSRPSATGPAGYDPTASGGSNLGPTNKALLDRVNASVQTFQSQNPDTAVPVDLVTASGSGLDPDISPAAGGVSSGTRGSRAGNERPTSSSASRETHTSAPIGIPRRATCQRPRTKSRSRQSVI